MADLVNLAITIIFFWLLHQLIEAIRDRRNNRKDSVLAHLGFDPDRHELEVLLQDGCNITGLPHDQLRGDFGDGLLLTDVRENGQGRRPSGSVTFIPASNILAIAVKERKKS